MQIHTMLPIIHLPNQGIKAERLEIRMAQWSIACRTFKGPAAPGGGEVFATSQVS